MLRTHANLQIFKIAREPRKMEQLPHSACNLKALVSWMEYGSSNQFRCVIMPCNIFALDLQFQATSFGVNFISFIRAAEATPVQDKKDFFINHTFINISSYLQGFSQFWYFIFPLEDNFRKFPSIDQEHWNNIHYPISSNNENVPT